MITLIRPPIITPKNTISSSSIVPPLNLAYLCASLKKAGFKTTIIDTVGAAINRIHVAEHNTQLTCLGLSIDQIISSIPSDTKYIGLSCMFANEWPYVKHLLKRIKRQKPHLTVIAGGENATALPEYMLQDASELDYILTGESDESLPDLLACLEQGKNVTTVKGLYYREKGRVLFSGKRSRIKDINTLPRPDWTAVPLENYLKQKTSHGPYRGRTMPVLLSRGCPYACTFCSNPKMWGSLYCYRDPRLVLDEIADYIRKYRVSCVEFYDLTPILKRSWIEQFCMQIQKRGLKFNWQMAGGTRTEGLDADILRKMKAAGCTYIGFAPESGSEMVLKDIHKKINLSRMVQLLHAAKKIGINTKANFVIGFPNDRRIDIARTLFLQIKLAIMGITDSPIFIFSPYPGSALFNELLRNGRINLDDRFFESLGLDVQKDKKGYCRNMSPRELSFYQFLGFMFFYEIYYLLRPWYMCLFVKNIITGNNQTHSVLEQRLIIRLQSVFGRLLKKQ
jgi:radical SAM superfamily enzyme YgiQ (UPF0313 family)